MKTYDLIVYGSLMLALLLYMSFLAWRRGILTIMVVELFSHGATEGVAGSMLAIAALMWYIDGLNTAAIVALTVFAVVWFILGRRVERYGNQLTNTS